MGRQLKENCSRCGVKKTPENTYIRGDKYLQNICKACSSEVAKVNRMKRMPEQEKNKLLEKYKRLLYSLKTVK